MMKPRFIYLSPLVLLLLLSACSTPPLLENVTVAPNIISPNADGTDDITKVTFQLNESATVAIYLYDEGGERYTFRAPAWLGVDREDPYTVYFGGIVNDYAKQIPSSYMILKQMLPNGEYTWEITAITNEGRSAKVTGPLTIKEADTSLPGIRELRIFPKTFSPNQDGIGDQVRLELILEKDVQDLSVYLEGPEGIPSFFIEDETEQITPQNAKGKHIFRYDGGIDAGNQPPPDGRYQVYAEARDKMGQHVVASDTLQIYNAGMPLTSIVEREVEFSSTTLILSDTLCYTLTVENESNTYIRTTGPWPGTTYRSDQNYEALGWAEDKGAFRVGLDYDTSLRNYPFRWGIGQPGGNLVEIDDKWYLPPEARSTITGCVRIVEVPVRNPLYYWAGLIHERMVTASLNNRVDPHFITIWEP